MTSRFTFDRHGKKAYLGTKVLYNDRVWLLEDINYLSWNSNQYLTLQDIKNQNKKINFVSPHDIKVLKA